LVNMPPAEESRIMSWLARKNFLQGNGIREKPQPSKTGVSIACLGNQIGESCFSFLIVSLLQGYYYYSVIISKPGSFCHGQSTTVHLVIFDGEETVPAMAPVPPYASSFASCNLCAWRGNHSCHGTSPPKRFLFRLM
jgi:hypothetical protein